ncbi:MAG: hypothetical protein Q9208_003376 [Pyrenodesmia sp. 3 TL-2023]
MTRRDLLNIFHEPFGDAFYFGPERISPSWTRWPADKISKSGMGHYTYNLVLQKILDAVKVQTVPSTYLSKKSNHTPHHHPQDQSKRVFIKDIAEHIVPPIHSPTASPPSLQHLFSPHEPRNPSLFPTSILQKFQFVFLIRNPVSAIPSLYRCFIPPLNAITDEYMLDPTEIGYREMRLLLDYLYPPSSRSSPGNQADIPVLIDADDLLVDPDAVISALCERIGVPYSPSMLSWPSTEDHAFAKSLFDKYAGYHEDALNSTGLEPKPAAQRHERPKSREELDKEWEEKYGAEGAKIIRDTVDMCQEDYEYLRQFRMQT